MSDAVPAARRAAPLLLALLLVAILLLLLRIADLLLLVFIAVLVAVYLSAVTAVAVRWARLPRPLALALAILATLAAFAAVAALVAPPVVQQTQDLIAAVPQYLTGLDATIAGWARRIPMLRRAGLTAGETGLVSSALRDAVAFVRHGIIPTATATGLVVIEGIAVLVMAVYLAVHPALYQEGALALVPPKHRSFARAILLDLAATLRAWVGAQLFEMVVLAILTGVGLWLLDVPYWLAFAIFTGVVALIPFFGTLFSTVLPALLVLPDRGVLIALAVASVGVGVHLVEANLVGPLVMHRRVALPPVLTILSVLIAAELSGLLGMLVAVPALAVVIVLVRHVLIDRAYGAGAAEVVLPPAVLVTTREMPVPAAARSPTA
ncbi:MAG TPA: AI-2E family transporter [Gemmatimonadales bacterium]|nr:AI-2E family transporter [Gemmatimonadales bacterium]